MTKFHIPKQLHQLIVSSNELTVVVLQVVGVFLLAGAESSLGGAVLFAAALRECELKSQVWIWGWKDEKGTSLGSKWRDEIYLSLTAPHRMAHINMFRIFEKRVLCVPFIRSPNSEGQRSPKIRFLKNGVCTYPRYLAWK